MKTLFLNTCTATTSLGVFEDDQMIVQTRFASRHDESEKLQTATVELFKKNKITPEMIDQIAVCVGPGGFTSARIGVCVANAWAFAKDIPLATCSVFDLHPKTETVIIPCNKNEVWMKTPGAEPEFISSDSPSFPPEMPSVLEEENFPPPSSLKFEYQQAKPWYYKDAKITWSKRIHQKS